MVEVPYRYLPALLTLPRALEFVGVEWLTQTFGTSIPWGEIALAGLCYTAGLLYSDWSAWCVKKFRSRGIKLKIHSQQLEHKEPFETVEHEGQLHRAIRFVVQNTAAETLDHVDIRAIADVIAHNDLTSEKIQSSLDVPFHFMRGETLLHRGSRNVVYLAHQDIATNRMFFGQPGLSKVEIFPGHYYRGFVRITAKGTKEKDAKFILDAMHFPDPVFRLRIFDSDVKI